MNSDDNFDVFVIVKNKTIAWTPSPESGVESKKLVRIGDGNAIQATSIVRFPADSYFEPHTHYAGEEFLVLEGIFSDSTGNFPQGFYVRNPPGSSHSPWSQPGAVIFAKIGQFDPKDTDYVRLDTKGADWQNYPKSGTKILLLHQFEHECVLLVSLEPGQSFSQTDFSGGLEIFVVSGQLTVSGNELETHDWLRRTDNGETKISSREGGLFYLKTGHLAANSTR